MAGQEINFDAKFLEAVIRGQKTMTTRYGWRKYATGKTTAVFTSGEVIAIQVKSVHQTSFLALTPEQALKDGFTSKDALYQELLNYYPMEPDSDVTLVEFSVIQ